MIKHVVMARLREDLPEAERDQLLADLRALPAQISLVRSLEVGLDRLRSARSWDLALVSEFDSLQALAEYAQHPAHVPVAQRLVAASTQVAAVDFDA